MCAASRKKEEKIDYKKNKEYGEIELGLHFKNLLRN